MRLAAVAALLAATLPQSPPSPNRVATGRDCRRRRHNASAMDVQALGRTAMVVGPDQMPIELGESKQ